MHGQLEGRVVVITGAGRGIGRGYALAMAAEGARVVVNDLGVAIDGSGASPALADEVVTEIRARGGNSIANHGDVSDDAAAAALVESALEHFGRLDALVNNAATEFRGTLLEHVPEQWDRVMAVNARGTLNCVRHAIPAMRDQGAGTIVNTTSGAFWEGTESAAAYGASKAAVFSLTLSQHTELSPLGITSNCIAPNATRTRLLDSWLAHLSQTSQLGEEEVAEKWGIQRPENLAPLAIFLCSEAARDISGQIFEVWGNRIHRMLPPTRSGHVERDGDVWRQEQLAEALPALARTATA